MAKYFLRFDGNQAPTSLSLVLNPSCAVGLSNFSVSFVTKPFASMSVRSLFGHLAFVDGEVYGWRVFLQNNCVRAYFYDGNGNSLVMFDSSSSIAFNQFVWVSITFDRSGFASLFINGVLNCQTDISSCAGWDLSPVASFLFGNYSLLTGQTFVGDFDDFRFFKGHVLSASEVLSIYNSGFGSVVSESSFPCSDGFYSGFDVTGMSVGFRLLSSSIWSSVSGLFFDNTHISFIEGGVPFFYGSDQLAPFKTFLMEQSIVNRLKSLVNPLTGNSLFRVVEVWKNQVGVESSGVESFHRFEPFAFVKFLPPSKGRSPLFGESPLKPQHSVDGGLWIPYRFAIFVGVSSVESGLARCGSLVFLGGNSLREIVIYSLNDFCPDIGIPIDSLQFYAELELLDMPKYYFFELDFLTKRSVVDESSSLPASPSSVLSAGSQISKTDYTSHSSHFYYDHSIKYYPSVGDDLKGPRVDRDFR